MKWIKDVPYQLDDLRNEFAKAALHGILSNPELVSTPSGCSWAPNKAFEIANDMLHEYMRNNAIV